ncbi:Alpha-actinin-like protein 1 [Yarrowia sp. C11]|nr:Alpha-actinin-like protein 1 [Yarrowia sp. C11]KAG5364754.1 Alpha-actinin-like protein 1 [Yarrowia sp. E02]
MSLPQWIATQHKAFLRWANTYFESNQIGTMVSLETDFCDGVRLCQLIEIIGKESLGRYSSQPRMRFQMIENVNTALAFIRHRGVQLHNIGAEDICDGNLKLILGLLWILILRFTIEDISEEGLSAKEGLLLWCQRKTAGYKGVAVKDFSGSWSDGLAFCALLDKHRPDLIDFSQLDPSQHRENMELAISIATEQIGIPQILDVEDICGVAKPDERSVMTYVAYWFHAFSALDMIENAGRRLEKFVEMTSSAYAMQSGYEERMRALLKAIATQKEKWTLAADPEHLAYAEVKQQTTEHATFKIKTKREWTREKASLASLLGNIRTKLATYNLKEYSPPVGLRSVDVEAAWKDLHQGEIHRSKLLNQSMRRLKESLRKRFADAANDFSDRLAVLSTAISQMDGPLEEQLEEIALISEKLRPLTEKLRLLKELDTSCLEANVEENDYTVYSYDELDYDLGLAKESVKKKLAFIENQIVARNMTNLTPIQLEEFESVFRHFDKSQHNALLETEFSGALASLGLVYSETEMHEVFRAASEGQVSVSFEQFITFMVEVTEDQLSAEQVLQSFAEVADGKMYVTELDLQNSLIPEPMIDQLKDTMPKTAEGFDYIAYMERLTL